MDAVVASGFQKAFIYHANGVEHLILQPSYRGVAKDFGIFLAVPEIPEIDKAQAAVFGELERLTRPPPPPVQTEDVVRAQVTTKSASWKGVSVVKQQLVGMYEASVLQASDKTSFTTWLQANGYFWPKEVEPVFEHYVKEKWFFVAMKVNRNVPQATRFNGPIQPVSVRFRQDEILMPMKMTSLTPGGVDFMYYLVTDAQIEAKNIPKATLKFSQRLDRTPWASRLAEFGQVYNLLNKNVFLTRQDDLHGVSGFAPHSLAPKLIGKLWLTKYQGHFNREDLGDDFVWTPKGPRLGEAVARTHLRTSLKGTMADEQLDKFLKAHKKGMRRIESVSLLADLFDTNKGYGKPTFINGIHVGDLAALGEEGSDEWQTVRIPVPKSVAHWVRPSGRRQGNKKVTIRVDNYGLEKKNGKRYLDAYNIRNVRIAVKYDDGSQWTSKTSEGTWCSIPKWKNCQGTPVSKWGDSVVVQF